MSWRRIFPKKPTVAQLHNQFHDFYTKHGFITTFTTGITTSHLIPLVHLSFVLTYILHETTSLLTAHVFSAFQMSCWHNNIRDEKSDTL